jgi:hypothetical protein
MGKPTIEMEIINDDRTLAIGFQHGSAPTYVTTFTAEGLDEFMQKLSLMRSGMMPAIAQEWKLGAPVRCCRDPVSCMEADLLAGDPLLHIRHERFGWLHFILTKSAARELGQALIKQADAPPPALAGRA